MLLTGDFDPEEYDRKMEQVQRGVRERHREKLQGGRGRKRNAFNTRRSSKVCCGVNTQISCLIFCVCVQMYNDDFYEQGEADDEETIQKMLEGGAATHFRCFSSFS